MTDVRTDDQQPKGTAAAVWVPIDDVCQWEGNPKSHDKASIDKLIKSMRRNIDGADRVVWGAPLVCRLDDGFLIAGHRRIAAADRLGLTHVPVRFVDIPLAEAKRLALADNRLAEDDPWNTELLAEALDQIQTELGSDAVFASGFDKAEADKLLASIGALEIPGAAGEDGDGFSDASQFNERTATVVTITAPPDAADDEGFKAEVAELCSTYEATFKLSIKSAK